MRFPFFGELRRFFDDHSELREVQQLREALAATLSRCDPEAIRNGYQRALELAEELLWRDGAQSSSLKRYQALFREYEAMLGAIGQDQRRPFVVVIPLADRPLHLRACLQSLLELCRAYHYGGLEGARFRAVQVVIADDSCDAASIEAHRKLAEEFSKAGLTVAHFDQKAQLDELARLPAELLKALRPVLGTVSPQRFCHKGASRMRNITYLLLRRLAEEDPRRLFLFLDSDQEFRVLQCLAKSRREVMAVNYFHHLERIFDGGGVTLLTGKVVGDPPVAPAVMAGNFLEDVIAFLGELRALPAAAACPFHGQGATEAGNAAYHDMANLFGFQPAGKPHRYVCPLSGVHDRLAVFNGFARRLNGFFDGQHPTRVTCYRHEPVAQSVRPARTVYTGNYVVNTDGLRYFIPFAALGLRMAGPVLGRLLRRELGERFVSANLPLLHRRTVEAIGESEFRPGVDRQDGAVDLSREFERQFYGDVMLFSMEELTEGGFPQQERSREEISAVVEATERRLRAQYEEKGREIRQRLKVLSNLLEEPGAWWHREPAAAGALLLFRRFQAGMEANFGAESRCRVRVDDEVNRGQRLESIVAAILEYPQSRRYWEQALGIPC